MENAKKELFDVTKIQGVIPHRYPFLLVDRIIEEGENKIVGLKNVTANEAHFQGHFPGHPVMPGVLILEALAQTAGVYALSRAQTAGKLAYFVSIDNAKFRRQVVPGDQLILEVTITKMRSRIIAVHGVARVDGQDAAEADMMFAVMGG